MTLAAFILSAIAGLLAIGFGWRTEPAGRPNYAPLLFVAVAVCLITWPWK